MRGRLGRGSFIGIWLITQFAVSIIFMIFCSWNYFFAVLIALIIISSCIIIFIIIGRLHDLGRPGFECWLILVPAYNIYMMYELLAVKGTNGPNAYGDDPLNSISKTETHNLPKSNQN